MNIFKNILLLAGATLVLFSCESNEKAPNEEAITSNEVNIYTHRHYDIDKEIFAEFEAKTGIKVNVIKDKADALLNKLEQEGAESPADLIVTVDAGRLVKAKEKGLLQAVNSDFLNSSIPASLRDQDNEWFGLTMRARVIVYSKDRVDTTTVKNYEDLALPAMNGKVLVRSSGNIYNQSLMASQLARKGDQRALAWAKGVVGNMAQDPKGNDRDQVKAIVAGIGDVALVNTYYIGKLLNSDNPEEVNAGEQVGIIFPNQDGYGTHINISGAGVTKYAPNKENAVKLLEFLTSKTTQQKYAEGNYEYPVVEGVEYSNLLKSWGQFKRDTLSLSKLGKLNKEAVLLFDQAGWK